LIKPLEVVEKRLLTKLVIVQQTTRTVSSRDSKPQPESSIERTMKETDYKPIDCGDYDTMEVLAMRRKECVIEFIDEHQQSRSITSKIVDVFAKSGEEFLQLESGQLIRLDHLMVVDNLPVPKDACRFTGHQ
jgi:Rho-binding antiterminator